MMDALPFQYQKRKYWEFYCPACKHLRRSFYWPSPRFKHYLALAVCALAQTLALWTWAGLKGIFLAIPVWAIFEFVYRARARQSLICPHCAFDPYLYKHDVKLARQKVEQHFAEKKRLRDASTSVQATSKPGPSSKP